MRPTPCGLVPLLLALTGSPEEPPSFQVISPETPARPEMIPEVTPAPEGRERAVRAPETPEATGSTGPEDDARQVRVLPEAPARPLTERAGDYETGLFARLVLSGRLGWSGVTLSRPMDAKGMTEGGELIAWDQLIHRAETLAVVSAALKLSAASTRPWVPTEAWLLDTKGERVGRFPVWMGVPMLYPGGRCIVVVEVELVPGASPRTLRLELREKDGGRVVAIGEMEL
ncbi:DUF2381 family protein [Archangium violaceum]|uniref:DUF2381 family protein n=1 Tax=Archangium violaceum TaxID=83451 RepID=UPI001952302B|nr:DUF2381 family protein [Archangium violaceum]QRN96523.1 DUF2381 family protein [Archangium violaceum]